MLLSGFLAFISLFSVFGGEGAGFIQKPRMASGLQEKMIVENGSAAIRLDLRRLNAAQGGKQNILLQFEAAPESFFQIVAFNGELRGLLPGSLPIATDEKAALPAKLGASYRNLVIESLPPGGPYELSIRDAASGFAFFNIEGHELAYNPLNRELEIKGGRLLLSREFAAAMKRPSREGMIAGELDMKASMRPVEVVEVLDGEAAAAKLPPMNAPEAGSVPGPDVVVGNISGLAQFGSSVGSQVGLALATDSCNYGTQSLNWFAMPNNDHPVIPQNLYRMSGGAANDERFEQIGQSSVKHGFTALANNLCGLGCSNPGTGTLLGSGCSDPYSASLNAGPNLGSRAWINPFTGAFPRGDSATPSNSHTGHTHVGTSHRILTEIADLNTSLNPGATYWAEGQYITPHEYAWCQANPGQCNMFNNISYRQYSVTGTGSPFSFTSVAATERARPAIHAWPGATLATLRPDPINDGIAIIGSKVTQTSPGVWHYEYAIYNQNLDRAIRSFSVPKGSGVSLRNIGFHAPPQHPGSAADGTAGNAGFSSAPWTVTQTANSITWSAETLAQNPNANAIRWGTLYNFRFDADRPPGFADALAPQAAGTLGFLKTGSPVAVIIPGPGLAPSAAGVSVAGRALSSDGLPVRNATVSLANSQGAAIQALTNQFGHYMLEDVPAGQGYVMSVFSKGYQFQPRVVNVEDSMTGVDFTAEP